MFARNYSPWLLVVMLVVAQFGGAPLRAEDGKFPMVDETELLEKIKKTGAELIAAGKAKGSKDLCKQMRDRATCELTLAPPLKEPIDDKQLYARACESIFVVVGLTKSKDLKDAKEIKDPKDDKAAKDSKEAKDAKEEKDGKDAKPGAADDDWELSSATAFAVTEDGVLTTSRHFFGDPEPATGFFAADCKGNIYTVEEILAADEKKDTCFFRISAKGLKPMSLGGNAAPGTRVRIVSHPGYYFYFFSAGHVANLYRDPDKILWMNVTADFGQGASGAPTFDDAGNVVGQVGSTLTLYANGPSVGDPMIQCRRVTGRRVQHLGSKRLADSPEKEPKAPATPPGAPPAAGELVPPPSPGDPQMVFKTCVPVETMRSLVKPKAEAPK